MQVEPNLCRSYRCAIGSFNISIRQRREATRAMTTIMRSRYTIRVESSRGSRETAETESSTDSPTATRPGDETNPRSAVIERQVCAERTQRSCNSTDVRIFAKRTQPKNTRQNPRAGKGIERHQISAKRTHGADVRSSMQTRRGWNEATNEPNEDWRNPTNEPNVVL